jgi:hypothetical protein
MFQFRSSRSQFRSFRSQFRSFRTWMMDVPNFGALDLFLKRYDNRKTVDIKCICFAYLFAMDPTTHSRARTMSVCVYYIYKWTHNAHAKHAYGMNIRTRIMNSRQLVQDVLPFMNVTPEAGGLNCSVPCVTRSFSSYEVSLKV